MYISFRTSGWWSVFVRPTVEIALLTREGNWGRAMRREETFQSGTEFGFRDTEMFRQRSRGGVDSVRQVDSEHLVQGVLARQSLSRRDLLRIADADKRVRH